MLLTFLWSCQKSGPYKMYMALRTFQKKLCHRILITTLVADPIATFINLIDIKSW